VELADGIGVRVPSWRLFGDRVLIQAIWGLVRSADLVIAEQANKLVFNYLLLAMSQLGLKHMAYWGHGYNHQQLDPSPSEWLKRKLVTRVDWWFAYTNGVTRYLIEQGVAPGVITTVQNTIDTAELQSAIAATSRQRARASLGIADDAVVGLFCGALAMEKRLEMLIEAATEVRAQIPTFELVVVGSGPDRARIDAAALERPFIRCVGPAFAADRAPYFAAADVFVMPALVGLSAVDAFTAGLPLFTTSLPTHGPEIEYVEPGVNGVITAPSGTALAAAIVRVLRDETLLRHLQAGARSMAARLSLSSMVDAFTDGILHCLGDSP